MGNWRRDLRILELDCQAVRLIYAPIILHRLNLSCYRYRVLAELMDQGTRAGLIIPIHKPAAQNASRTVGAAELDIARTLGVNPSHALQHSGYYYYMAAKCTEMRRTRFVAALEAEVCQYLSHLLTYSLYRSS
jgi:hypothetical protein